MEIIRKGKIVFSTSISLQILEITARGKMVPEQLFIGHRAWSWDFLRTAV